jgi:2,5-diketo-D-gluconate reductase A
MTALSPTIPRRGGAGIPALGLGTWPKDDGTAARVVAEAIDLGDRLVDTAENDENERGVGKGVRAETSAIGALTFGHRPRSSGS